MSSRIPAMAAMSVVVVLAFFGCNNGEPQFDPATKYSPETLAQEFSFRYKSLGSESGGAVPVGTESATARKEAETKGASATTKEAPANTLAGLLDDMIAKAASIPGLTPADARRKLAEAIAKDTTIPADHQKVIADKLGKASD